MAIYYECEFDTSTPVGYAHCTTSDGIYKDYRDISTVEGVIKTIKKLFANDNYHAQCVTFFAKTERKGKHEVARLWYNYKDHYDLVIFEGVGAYSNLTREKVDAKLIREIYLNCADYTISVELKEAERKAV